MRQFLPLLVVLLGGAQAQSYIRHSDIFETCGAAVPCTVGGSECSAAPTDGSVCVEDPLDPNYLTCQCHPETDFFAECEQNQCFKFSEKTEGSVCTLPLHCGKIADENLVTCNLTTPVGDPKYGHCECTDIAVGNSTTGRCYLKATGIGQSCEVEAQCEGLQYAECTFANEVDPTDGRCECTDIAVGNYTTGQCYLKATDIGERCEVLAQCEHLGHAECVVVNDRGLCNCIGWPDANSYHYEYATCFQLSEALGELCDVTGQCKLFQGDKPNNVECSPNNTCECVVEDALQLNDQCYSYVDFDNQPCIFTEQCHNDYPDFFTECIDPDLDDDDSTKFCRCASGYVDVIQPGPQTSCKTVVSTEGGRCEHTRQCTEGMGDNSHCDGLLCRCINQTEYYNAPDSNVKCFLPRALDQVCTYTGECIISRGAGPNSYCAKVGNSTTGLCKCTPTSIDWQGHCYLKKLVGDACTSHEECTVPIRGNVECDQVQKRCTCQVDHVPDFGGTECRSGSAKIQLTFTFMLFAFLKFFV